MKRFVIPAAVLLTVLILTGGFFLPTLVLKYKDRQTIGELKITDGSSVSYETKSELKTIDRLNIITNGGMLEVDNGKNMNADKAFQSALTELAIFEDKGVLEVDRATSRLMRYDVMFLIDSADPSKNMIVWYIFIQDEIRDIHVAVDDETGILLTLDYNLNKQALKDGIMLTPRPEITEKSADDAASASDAGGSTVMELIGRTLADYYGLTLVSTNLRSSEYFARFAFELGDGEESVVLSVTVTDTGFYFSA